MNMVSRLLFPQKCAGCNQPLVSKEVALCLHCQTNLPVLINPRGKQVVQRSLEGRVPNIQSFAFLQYRSGGNVQRMLHQLKYHGKEEVGQVLGYLFGKHLKNHLKEKSCLVPVPLHYKKLQVRGFNQCHAICLGLADALNIDIKPQLLIRVKNKGSLTKLNRLERAEATTSLYSAAKPVSNCQEVVCVVDDVITTGATMAACCEALYNAGWKNIVALSLCYADS